MKHVKQKTYQRHLIKESIQGKLLLLLSLLLLLLLLLLVVVVLLLLLLLLLWLYYDKINRVLVDGRSIPVPWSCFRQKLLREYSNCQM